MSFRICSSVLLDYSDYAIQSYNFKNQRVLGSVENVIKFLDRYMVDEIHLISILKGKCEKDIINTFKRISKISVSTPLAIGGGIRNHNIKEILSELFFERCIFNSAVFNNFESVDFID